MSTHRPTSKVCYKWAFAEDPPSNETRARMQVISDVYRAIQTRLDAYRQSAGAAFLAVFASAVAFDSTVVRLYFEKGSLQKLPHELIISSAFIIPIICGVAIYIIQQYKVHFEKMTSIIYKIDSANEVWTKGVWLENETLYPAEFGEVVNLRKFEHDPLYGWKDPLILTFRGLIAIILVLHLVFFLAVYISLAESMVTAVGCVL